MKKMRRKKDKLAWAGYCNDRIDICIEAETGYRLLAIFPNRTVAKLAYEDVRAIIIKEI